jgi:hypothetical protein
MMITSYRRSAVACPDRFWLCSLLSYACLLGCGDSRSQAVEVDDLGAACGVAKVVVAGAVEVDDQTVECESVCLHSDAVAPPGTTSAGECSCRCAGPASTGPFCACSAGFSCEEEVRDLGAGERELTGSYCIARP